ncbi:1071_t:CDS:2 [Paraglomus brasilianum]|uniref:1071_t:CDS:1 n=1 Tax=Paraglomus brasilianum TaxID=144538 RepID=A0A9N9FB83_9GLOM|nr:1071_t:CDS:2 [Paraglomus brasilianum]
MELKEINFLEKSEDWPSQEVVKTIYKASSETYALDAAVHDADLFDVQE